MAGGQRVRVEDGRALAWMPSFVLYFRAAPDGDGAGRTS